MIVPKYCLLLGVLALIGGCASRPCVAPGEISREPLQHCYYQFQVTGIDTTNNLVTVKMPNVLYDKRSGEEFRSPNSEKTYTLRVRDLNILGDKVKDNDGKTYEFVREGNSPEFEFVHELDRKQEQ